MQKVLIVKGNGEREFFEPHKLRRSLIRVGADEGEADKIVEIIHKKIKEGDTTQKIYRQAFSQLKKLRQGVAARYSLRRALGALGPSGFPFELFVAQLFASQGFETEVGLNLRGKCSTHEIDLLAKDNKKLLVGEVKFHNNYNMKSDTKVMLYVHARYLDLQRSNFDGHNPDNLPAQCWLITNTKFTTGTIDYANCYGLKLLGWDYPDDNKESLRALIEKNNLEPVTVLTSLKQEEKKRLMSEGVVLCRGLNENLEALDELDLSDQRRSRVVAEVGNVCDPDFSAVKNSNG